MSRRNGPADQLAELIMSLIGGAGLGLIIGAILSVIILFLIGYLISHGII